MRSTNLEFPNTLAGNLPPAAFISFFTPPAASVVIVDQNSYVVYVDVPVTYGTIQSPTNELLDRLSTLKAKYSSAWLPSSTPVRESAFQNARDFVLTLPLNRILKPAIHVASDGEVNFQWMGTDFQIDLGFYGDGNFSFYGAKSGRKPILGDGVPVKQGIPKELADFASSI